MDFWFGILFAFLSAGIIFAAMMRKQEERIKRAEKEYDLKMRILNAKYSSKTRKRSSK